RDCRRVMRIRVAVAVQASAGPGSGPALMPLYADLQRMPKAISSVVLRALRRPTALLMINREHCTRFEQHAGRAGADHRRNDEEPELTKGLRIVEDSNQRRPNRARRIHRYTGHVDTDDVNCRQGQADRQPRKADEMGWRTLLRDAQDDD